jgi:putative restriction endonuclease
MSLGVSSGDLGSRGGRQAYFAAARVTAVRPDARNSDHFYAFISDFLQFDRPVPFKEREHYYEASLQRPDGQTSKGAFGRAVRPITETEFDLIVRAGFEPVLGAAPAIEAVPTAVRSPGASEEPATFDRPIVEQFTSRPFRDAAFSEAVKSAYHNTCAITGLKIINGGGRAEVQAAHKGRWRRQAPTLYETASRCVVRFIGCLIAACSRWTMITGCSRPEVVFLSQFLG